jgi:hypothetical protein
MLLDPTDPADPPLLTFDTDGRIAPSPCCEGDAVSTARVEDSRIGLHLDWPAFVQDRRDLYVHILLKVLDGDQADAALSVGESGARETLKSIARDLIRLTRDKETYSRAAVAYILRFRDRHWVKRNVLPHLPAASVV